MSSCSQRVQNSTSRKGPVVLGALTGLLYLIYLCPGIYWRDAGELSASAFGLGVAHPTGFSLYIFVGKAATLLPFGSIAFRVNLLSALCAALTVALFYRIALRLLGNTGACSRAAVAASALIFATGGTFWLHATTAEVYIPNLFFVALLLDRLLVVMQTGSTRSLTSAAVLTGLGAGLHAVFALVAAGAWTVTLGHRWSRLGPDARGKVIRREVMWLLVLGLAGAMVLLYLPLRASQAPWRNWGDPSTLSAFIAHITGSRIRDAFGAQMGLDALLSANLSQAFLQLANQVSWAGLGALIGGLVLLFRRRSVGLCLLVIFLADLMFTVVLNPMGMVDLQTGLVTAFCASLALAVGFGWVGERWVRPEFSPRVAPALVFIAVLGLGFPAVFAGGMVRDNRRLTLPYERIELIFDQVAPTGSLLLVTSDDLASAATYAQGVENRRPDCTTVVRQHVSDTSYVERLRSAQGEEHLSAGWIQASANGRTTRELLAELLEVHRDRTPIFWEVGDPATDRLVNEELRVDLPLSRLFGEEPRSFSSRMVDYRARWRALSFGPWHPTSLQTLARRYTLLGTQLLRQGKREAGKQAIQEAYLVFPADSQVTNNYGNLLMSGGSLETAEHRFEELVTMRPTYATGWFNLGVARFQGGKFRQAREAFEAAARFGADRGQVARMTYWSAIAHANVGEFDVALLLIEQVLEELPPSLRREAVENLLSLTRLRNGSSD